MIYLFNVIVNMWFKEKTSNKVHFFRLIKYNMHFLEKTSNMSLVSIEIVMLSMELQNKRKKLEKRCQKYLILSVKPIIYLYCLFFSCYIHSFITCQASNKFKFTKYEIWIWKLLNLKLSPVLHFQQNSVKSIFHQ